MKEVSNTRNTYGTFYFRSLRVVALAVFVLLTCEISSSSFFATSNFIEFSRHLTEKPNKIDDKNQPPLKAVLGEIMGQGRQTPETLTRFLLSNNPFADRQKAVEIAEYYVSEAIKEQVNHDVAFCQMCLETGFLKFDGIVSPAQNNFCGLGAVNKWNTGERFSSEREGIIAHIQHLKAYASHEKLNGRLIDRRFRYVERGVASNVDDLTGKWAMDPYYGKKIRGLLARLNAFSGN